MIITPSKVQLRSLMHPLSLVFAASSVFYTAFAYEIPVHLPPPLHTTYICHIIACASSHCLNVGFDGATFVKASLTRPSPGTKSLILLPVLVCCEALLDAVHQDICPGLQVEVWRKDAAVPQSHDSERSRRAEMLER